MTFERGWPFSFVDQLRDLRYDISTEGLLRGIPSWFVGQALRYREVYEASKIKGVEQANRLHKQGLPINNKGGTAIAFVSYYVRLLMVATATLLTIVVPPLFLGKSGLNLLNGQLAAAGQSIGKAVLFAALLYWLVAGDYDRRPGATLAD